MQKDILLLWRDRSIWIVVLLLCIPFSSMLRSPTATGAMDQVSVDHSMAPPWLLADEPGPSTTVSSTGQTKHVLIGVVEGTPVPLDDPIFEYVAMTREQGIEALKHGKVDVLARFPVTTTPDQRMTAEPQPITIVYRSDERGESYSSVEKFEQRLRSLDLQHRHDMVARIHESNSDWLLCSIKYHSLGKFSGSRLSPFSSSKATLLSGPLVLAGALISSLVMLIIVEENARHTLPLVLVCAVDRRVVFLSKMALCMLPAAGVVISMMVRFWKNMPPHIPGATATLMLATAGGAGLLFVFIVCALLVASGGRSRNNVEALAKVGAPTVLAGFLAAMAYSPLAAFTPGLIVFPLTNIVFCLNELLTANPDWFLCACALGTSTLLAFFLAKNGALAMRTEQGLAGDVSVKDPKLDSLLLFLLAAAAAVLLTNFIGLPASIVFPSVGSLAYITILLVIGAGVLRVFRASAGAAGVLEALGAVSAADQISDLSDRSSSRNRMLFSSICAVLLAFLTSFVFSSSTPVGSLSSEIARIESVTRNAASPTLLFTFALLHSIVEEFVLRGLLIRLLIPYFSPITIILLLSALGAALHPLADTWLLVLVLSAVLTTVRLYSRSVIPCVVLHATHTICLWLLWHRVVQ